MQRNVFPQRSAKQYRLNTMYLIDVSAARDVLNLYKFSVIFHKTHTHTHSSQSAVTSSPTYQCIYFGGSIL